MIEVTAITEISSYPRRVNLTALNSVGFLKFLLEQRKKNNGGFSLAFVLAIGVVMSLSAAAMMIDSTNQKQRTQIQQETAQNRTMADAVISRLKYRFSQPIFAYFLLFEQEEWKDHIKDYEARLCRPDKEYNPIAQQIWELGEKEKISIENKSYFLSGFTRINERQALLSATVEGENGSSSTIQADIFFQFSYLDVNTNVPSFFSEINNSKRSQFKGNVWIFDPSCSSQLKVYEPYKLKYVPFTIPKLLNINRIKSHLSSSHELTLDDTYEETNITLPRPEDNQTRKENIYEYYEYILSNVKNKSINIETKPNTIVVLHIEGNMSKTKITHTCGGSTQCPAQNLIILGHGNSNFCFVFDELNAMIIAPEGKVGIKPETPYQPATVTGTVWTKKLNTTENCGDQRVTFVESLTFKDMPKELQIRSIYPKIKIDFKGRTETISGQQNEPFYIPELIAPQHNIPVSIEP